MFKEIKDKLKLVFSGKGYRSEDKVKDNIENADEKKPIKTLKIQNIERNDDREQLKKKLRRIAKNTKTYRIRKKNIKRLMKLFIK